MCSEAIRQKVPAVTRRFQVSASSAMPFSDSGHGGSSRSSPQWRQCSCLITNGLPVITLLRTVRAHSLPATNAGVDNLEALHVHTWRSRQARSPLKMGRTPGSGTAHAAAVVQMGRAACSGSGEVLPNFPRRSWWRGFSSDTVDGRVSTSSLTSRCASPAETDHLVVTTSIPRLCHVRVPAGAGLGMEVPLCTARGTEPERTLVHEHPASMMP